MADIHLTQAERDELKKVAFASFAASWHRELQFWEAVRDFDGSLNQMIGGLPDAHSRGVFKHIWYKVNDEYSRSKDVALAAKRERMTLAKTVIEYDNIASSSTARPMCIKAGAPAPPPALKRQRLE